MTLALVVGSPPPVRPLQPQRSPSAWAPTVAGPYRLPRELHERLGASIAGRRNRDAVYALAVYLARHWSTPGRLLRAFPVDRRALSQSAGLELSEDRVRGALAALEAVGFLERQEVGGPAYQRTADGPHRRPILFRFGSDYAPGFERANASALAARRRRDRATRLIAAPASVPRPLVPHKQSLADSVVLMGDGAGGGENRALECALLRWHQAIAATAEQQWPSQGCRDRQGVCERSGLRKA